MSALRFVGPSVFLVVATVIAACSSDAPNIGPADGGVDAHLAPGTGDPDAGGDAASPPRDAAPAGPTIGLAAAADQLADAECAFAQRCFPTYVSQFVSSIAECKSGLSVEARGRYAPGAAFDKAAVDASTSCFQMLPCDQLYGHDLDTLCARPKPSNAAPMGAECNKPNDCASVFCDGKTDVACGHCAASVVGNIGDACNYFAGKLCPAGAFCNGTCVAVREIGDACNGTMTCGNALKCVSGKCAKPGALGATCSDSSQCDLFQLLTCDKVAGQCAAIAFVGAGAACDTSESTPPCANGLHCIAPAGSSSGTCQVGVQPGMACTRSSSCTLGYHCGGGICKAAGVELPVCK